MNNNEYITMLKMRNNKYDIMLYYCINENSVDIYIEMRRVL